MYGAIAYYLAHREEIDAHLRIEEADFEEKSRLARERNPQLHQRIQMAAFNAIKALDSNAKNRGVK